MKTNLKIYTILFLVVVISIFQSGCKKDSDEPNPIIVENIMNPTSAAHGSTIQWDIKITNLGEAIEITQLHTKQVCTSGWAKGQVLNDLDLPFADGFFDVDESRIIFTSPVVVLNSGPSDVIIQNTVTAYYSGGSVSTASTYTIYKAATKSGESKVEVTIKE